MKTILVHIDTDETNSTRLEAAVSLAGQFNAHLIGTHIMESPPAILYPATLAALPANFIVNQREQQATAAEKLKAEFDDMVRHAGIIAEWRQSEGLLKKSLVHQSRTADLTVVSHAFDLIVPDHITSIASSLVLASGLPVLSIPSQAGPVHFYKNILVAWNNSQQAARAIHDALPLLKTASQITVATVGNYTEHDLPTADICAHLARHDLDVKTIILEAKQDEEGVLLDYASNIKADLIVAGAWGHTRVIELVLGGFTRSLLNNQEIPIFISH